VGLLIRVSQTMVLEVAFLVKGLLADITAPRFESCKDY
jgi:hypothetical protein